MFLLNGATISGCIHTDYGEEPIIQIPADRIEILDWTDVDYKTESLYKGITRREHSIQEYIMNKLSERGATIIFNDDNSITFLLTDYYYNLPIERGELILWQR